MMVNIYTYMYVCQFRGRLLDKNIIGTYLNKIGANMYEYIKSNSKNITRNANTSVCVELYIHCLKSLRVLSLEYVHVKNMCIYMYVQI